MKKIVPYFLTLALPFAARGEVQTQIDFNRDIRPILSENCYTCHGPDTNKRKAGLRFDQKESAFGKAESGEVPIIPGEPEKSELVRRITTDDKDDAMPPPKEHKKLKPAQVELLRRWIQSGAKWDGHWAFQPVKPVPVPEIRNAKSAIRNPIDAFVLARLEKEKLTLSPEAAKTALIRRVSLDLIGLPPTIQEVEAFLADTAPNAYEKVVDRLLASPHFGERLAVPWLDLARYGDTSGYHNDSLRDMWLWREGVIKAFNANLPFSQFTIEQLAGDLLPQATLDQKVASGFHRNVMTSDEGGIIEEEYLNLYVVDRVATTGITWLGLTVGCAQCHDHKYDPLKQREFYQLYSFFHNVPENGKDGVRDRNPKPFLAVALPEQKEQLAKLDVAMTEAQRAEAEGAKAEAAAAKALETQQLEWEKKQAEIAASCEPGGPNDAMMDAVRTPAEQRTKEQKERLQKIYRETDGASLVAEQKKVQQTVAGVRKKIADLKKDRGNIEKAVPNTMVMSEMDKPRDTFIKVRGQYDQKGEKVAPAAPAFLPQLPAQPANGQRYTRLDLARWLVSPEQPLTARVTVNRFWKMFFGTGLVKTLNDFGSQGEWPSHPELLDWLAGDFMRDWDVKRVLKQMVMSATYRQSAKVTPQLLETDSENRLLARGPRQRLDAEFLRDNALAAAGILNPALGGKSIKPAQPAGTWEINEMSGYNYVKSQGADLYRRGLYVYWRRSTVYPSFITLDAPTREFCSAQRARTSTPLQSLVLMNDPVFVEAARAFAQRILKEGGADDAARLSFAWRTVLARPATAKETAIMAKTLEMQLATYSTDKAAAAALVKVGDLAKPADLDDSKVAAWTAVANVLLNLNETITN